MFPFGVGVGELLKFLTTWQFLAQGRRYWSLLRLLCAHVVLIAQAFPRCVRVRVSGARARAHVQASGLAV